MEKGEFHDRPYFALKTSQGGIVDGIGYISGYAEVGGYIKDESIQQGTLKTGMFYCPNLMRAGSYRFRQFKSIDTPMDSTDLQDLEKAYTSTITTALEAMWAIA